MQPRIVLADARYNSKNYLLTLKYGVTPIIAINKRKMKRSVISRLKEELALRDVKVRGLSNVRIHVTFSLTAMLTVALVAFKTGNGHKATSVNSFRF